MRFAPQHEDIMPFQEKGNMRVPTMFNEKFKDDPTQKIEQWPDGSIHRRITKDEKESHQIWHATGAYTEIRPDGSRVDFHSNNSVAYSKGGTTMSIDNHGDVRMSGSNRINVDVDAHITFGKDVSIMGGGRMSVEAQGGLKMAGADVGLMSTSGAVAINSDREVAIKSANKTSIHSEGVMTMTTGGGDIHMASGGELDFNSKGDASMKTNGKMAMHAKGSMAVTASGAATFGGSTAKLASSGGTTVASGGNITVGSKQTSPDTAQFDPGGGDQGSVPSASV